MTLTKKQRTDKTILHAAKVLFEKKGMDCVTFDDIAEQAGICRTTVFNHFPGISDLLSAMSAEEIDELAQYCEQSQKSGMELITLLFDKLIEDLTIYPTMMTRLTNNLILSQDSSSIVNIESVIMRNLPPCGLEPRRAAQVVMGIYYGQVNHRHINKLEFDAEEMKREFHTILNYVLFGGTQQ